MLIGNEQPDGVAQTDYYLNIPTDHYSRIVHAASLDRLGYGFPYDDVRPDGKPDLEGKVVAEASDFVKSFVVTLGGGQYRK